MSTFENIFRDFPSYDTLKFRTFTKLAAEKAQNCGTLIKPEYSHLIPNQYQLCDHHYLIIVEPNRKNYNNSTIKQNFQNLQKFSELKWDDIHLEILDDKVCIPKQDFLKLVSNIEYLQENQKDEIIETINESSENIQTFENIDKNIEANTEDHFEKINKYFNEELNYLYIFNLDNFHSIHEIRRPDATFLYSVKHFATCTAKKVNLSLLILANYNNISLFNSVNIDAQNLCRYLKEKYSSLFDISYNNSKSQWISYSSLELIYLSKELGYQDNSFKSFHYYLPALGVTVSTKQLPCRYSTKKIPSLNNCDLCDSNLKDEFQSEVLICSHGYHSICYNIMERRLLSDKDKVENEFINKLVDVLNW
ncbi:1162_t:CDS:2 [Scutellospora calospora]|uniref:1162_t:CDS:1 n=1 Tax=Scutellospora calospora TaxID=85575 RepID=A0ACA9K4D9_9GLOM|nr:1162_t:CDS:2 [Scutellospora calospora]